MKRTLVVCLSILLALSVFVPTSSAHNCNSGSAGGCGPCPDGESHAHNDPDNQCQSSASMIPGFTAAMLLAALGVALLVGGRVRR